ncbi:MAG: hypothetical protein JWM87_1737 [Candidatus Eremiobacteraeota bacterium]|nr:hypothetical protein [Candidatus Eremiobacteraeota bacterium]
MTAVWAMRTCEISQPAGNGYRHAGAVLRTGAVGSGVADSVLETGCAGTHAAHSPITVKIANARISTSFPNRG